MKHSITNPSVVIPTHNTRRLTLACLTSVLRQQPEPGEVVLVDDGSSDGTSQAVAALFPTVRQLVSPTASGFSAAANRGLAAAGGELVLLLNSDTELVPGALAALSQAFARRPRLGIAGGALFYPDGAPQWSGGSAPNGRWLFALASGLPALLARLPLWRRLRPVSGAGDDGGGPLPVDWVPGAAMALRRQVWQQVGPFDEDYAFYAQDLDLCLAAAERGWAVAVVPGARVLHHHGATLGGGAGGVQRPELLWADLVRCAGKRGGPQAARRAARALLWGGRLRLAARRLAGALLPPSRRRAWRRDSAGWRRATAAVRTAAAAHSAPSSEL